MRFTALVVVLLVSLVLAACGSAATPTPSPSPAVEAREIKVSLFNFRFDPNTINVEAGETVKFTATNNTDIFHTFSLALSTRKEEIILDLQLGRRQTKSEIITIPSDIESLYLVCLPHEYGLDMTGTVHVGD